jgi:UDP-N-acetylglucosamine 2-epimerase
VFDMHNLMDRCSFVLTDSGGLQEEAPALSKPVLVTRTETERPEAVEAGTVKIVGVDHDTVYSELKRLLDDEGEYIKMCHAANPYGKGDTSEAICNILKSMK